jgi:hypothetical protein
VARDLDYAHAVEQYLRGNSMPRYMQRLGELDREYRALRQALADEHERLAESCEQEGLAEQWEATVRSWRFDDLNALVREHNAYYPLESNLPMDPRTRDFVTVRGQSYRRLEITPDWVLEHFPALPLRAPREPL